MAKQFKIPNQSVKYILFQRTEYLTLTNNSLFRFLRKLFSFLNYNRSVGIEAILRNKEIKTMYMVDMESEYESIMSFLPNNCSSILDVGCGVAGIDLFLNEHYLNRGVEFFLLDKNEIEEDIFYNYAEKTAFYNSLDVAKDLLVQNGVKNEKVHLIEATEKNDINIDIGVDLVLSLISWGFHYPVGVYLEKVYNLLNDEGGLILDVRKNTDGLDMITQKFGDYRIIKETNTYTRVFAAK